MQNTISAKTYRILLADRQGRGFSEYEVTDILRQVLPQLAQIHTQGFVHSGISLDTLVQNQQTFQSVLIASNSFTTSGYIAPELLQTAQVSPTGDVYALGVAIAVLLTSKEPELLHNYDGTWNWQDHCVVSDQFAEFLDRAISSNPQSRYANAEQMLQGINLPATTWFSPSVTSVIPQTTVKQAQLSAWQWGAIGAGITAMAGLAGFGIFILLSPKSEPVIVNAPSPTALQVIPTPNLSSTPSSTPTATSVPQVTPINPFEKAIFPQAACGDSLPENPNAYPINLYPIFIEYSERNLQIINSQFCKDAFPKIRNDTGKKAIQVASFTDFERTILFKDFISKKIGGADIGKPTRIENKRSSEIITPVLVGTERVSFASGSTQVSISSNLSSNQSRHYLLNCGQGQRFTARILQGNVNMSLISPNNQTISTAINGNSQLQAQLPYTGDYTVEISSFNGSGYTLNIEVL